MAKLSELFGGYFDANQYEPAREFQLYNPGQYPSQIESVEIKPTKANNGAFFEVKMVMLEEPYKGQRLTDRINVDNPSTACVAIGRGQLTALCLAAGIAKLDDTDQLLQCVVVPHVKVKGEQNEIRTYSSIADYRAKQQQSPAQGPPSTAAPSTPATALATPWSRKTA